MRRSGTPSKLSDSVNRRLNSYALAASAAGVGVLALTQPAEGKIIYTKTLVKIGPGKDLTLDLGRSGKAHFLFLNYLRSSRYEEANELKVRPIAPNAIFSHAAVESSGVSVGPGGQFETGTQLMGGFYRACSVQAGAPGSCQSSTRGEWHNVTGGYLGMKFLV